MYAEFTFAKEKLSEVAEHLLRHATGEWGFVESLAKSQYQYWRGDSRGSIEPREFWKREPVGLSLPARIDSGTGNCWSLADEGELVRMRYRGSRGSFLKNSCVHEWLKPLVNTGQVELYWHRSNLPGLQVWDSTDDWIRTVSDGAKKFFLPYGEEEKELKAAFSNAVVELAIAAAASRPDYDPHHGEVEIRGEEHMLLRRALYEAWQAAQQVAAAQRLLMAGALMRVRPKGAKAKQIILAEAAEMGEVHFPQPRPEVNLEALMRQSTEED